MIAKDQVTADKAVPFIHFYKLCIFIQYTDLVMNHLSSSPFKHMNTINIQKNKTLLDCLLYAIL